MKSSGLPQKIGAGSKHLVICLLLVSSALCQYKSTANSPFERPNLANSNMTKPSGEAPTRQRTTIGLAPSATYKVFSHENYTLPEKDAQAEDLNLENYYTVSLGPKASTVDLE